ncbi:hypothetical protein V1509DRAFT_364963 [Lipomyces kononenkoae]
MAMRIVFTKLPNMLHSVTPALAVSLHIGLAPRHCCFKRRMSMQIGKTNTTAQSLRDLPKRFFHSRHAAPFYYFREYQYDLSSSKTISRFFPHPCKCGMVSQHQLTTVVLHQNQGLRPTVAKSPRHKPCWCKRAGSQT